MFVSGIKARGYCGIDLSCELTSTQISVVDQDDFTDAGGGSNAGDTGCVDWNGQMRYTTYGIRITDSLGNELINLADISQEEQRVRQLVSLYNGGGVSAVHVVDILEDFLV